MATTDTELKKLNKTVEDALNLLKAYVGNSAQVKNMNEKQREAINKWFDVTEDAKETQKRQRAFTERARDEQGRFIKKQEMSANTFMKMAKSVGSMFSKVTMGIKNSIVSFTSGITSHFSNFFQAVKSQFLSLFGEESEWFELLGSIKDSMKNFVGSIARGFLMIFRRTPSWAKDQIKVLKNMYKLQLKQMKMDFLDVRGKKKKSTIWGLLTTILIGIAAGIGAWLHRYIVLLTKLPIFSKIAKMFQVIDDIPFIGKLFKAVKFGFKWLGWPLTILLSIIDFIKGFRESEGTLWEKIKEGLWQTLAGFIELPVKFIGWVVEKVAGFFGIALKDVGQKMMDTLKMGFNFLLNLPMMIVDYIKTMHTFFVSFWDSIVEWMITKVPSWLPGSKTIIAGLKSMQLNTPTTSETSVTKAMTDTDKKKIETQKRSDKALEDAINMMGENVKDGNRKTGEAINAISQVQGGSNVSTGETQQIPDEIDNNFVSLQNYAGELS